MDERKNCNLYSYKVVYCNIFIYVYVSMILSVLQEFWKIKNHSKHYIIKDTIVNFNQLKEILP